MRKSAAAPSIAASRITDRAAPRPGAAALVQPTRILLVFLALVEDFDGRDIDIAGRERVADKEIVGLVGIEVGPFLEVRILDDRQRQLDGLRNRLAFQRGDRRLDSNSDLRRAGAR